jgi:ABC-type sugar transport system ATPase subunit
MKYYYKSLKLSQNDKYHIYINHKMKHTFQVCSAIQRIISIEGKLVDLQKDFRKTAVVNAIFHDI